MHPYLGRWCFVHLPAPGQQATLIAICRVLEGIKSDRYLSHKPANPSHFAPPFCSKCATVANLAFRRQIRAKHAQKGRFATIQETSSGHSPPHSGCMVAGGGGGLAGLGWAGWVWLVGWLVCMVVVGWVWLVGWLVCMVVVGWVWLVGWLVAWWLFDLVPTYYILHSTYYIVHSI